MNVNFAAILFVGSIILGVPWLIDKIYLAPQRRRQAEAAVNQFDQKIERGDIAVAPEALAHQREQIRADLTRQPLWLEYTAGFFPVILVVFFLRSFLYEPFKIPSGSMLPTLHVDDLILVNKFNYGVRLPVLNQKIINVGSPQRGDVMVFRYPLKPEQDYIKRVVGIPGDTIEFSDQRLSVNGQLTGFKPDGVFVESEKLQRYSQYSESLGKNDHKVLTDLNKRSQISPQADFIKPENCRFTVEKLSCKVPEGHYFMMGDNRDNSADSRFWGFVPEENIVGRAFFIWMNFGNMSRIGSFN
jgi:signal peptidase I